MTTDEFRDILMDEFGFELLNYPRESGFEVGTYLYDDKNNSQVSICYVPKETQLRLSADFGSHLVYRDNNYTHTHFFEDKNYYDGLYEEIVSYLRSPSS